MVGSFVHVLFASLCPFFLVDVRVKGDNIHGGKVNVVVSDGELVKTDFFDKVCGVFDEGGDFGSSSFEERVNKF